MAMAFRWNGGADAGEDEAQGDVNGRKLHDYGYRDQLAAFMWCALGLLM